MTHDGYSFSMSTESTSIAVWQVRVVLWRKGRR